MLRVEIAKDVTDPRFMRLFSISFPENEKIPFGNLYRTFGRGGTLYFFFDSDEFIGFCFTFEYDGTIFLVYLATEPSKRGLGYGSEILDYMASVKKHRNMFLVLEKETGTPDEVKLRHRRCEFYKRNGWKETGVELLSDGYYFNSLYLDNSIPEDEMITTIRVYEETHTGVRCS